MRFSHNQHYHPWLLSQVPAGCRHGLDVGCGTGRFARLLAGRVERVDAIDRAPEMIEAARAESAGVRNVRYRTTDVTSTDLDSYDFISCIASIHHVPFAETVRRLRDALTPGGVLAIIGLARETVPDYVRGAVAFWPNRVRMLATRRQPDDPPAPIKEPTMSLAEIKRQAGVLLPGVRIRRRLYFRYSLRYRRPS